MKKMCFYVQPFPCIKSYYDMIDAAVEYNVNAVEAFCMFEFEKPDMNAAKRIREYADSKGVIFPCFSVFAEYAADKATIRQLKGYADVAKILGSPYLHHTIVGECQDYNKVLNNKEELFKNGITAVREIYDYAESIGVRAIYEEQGYIFNGIENFGRFLNDVNRDVGVVADFGNIYQSKDDLLDFIEAYGDKVVHAHIKDVSLSDTNCDGNGLSSLCGKYMYEEQVGDGFVKIKEAIELLKKSGYSGYYGLEFSASEDNLPIMAENINMISKWI